MRRTTRTRRSSWPSSRRSWIAPESGPLRAAARQREIVGGALAAPGSRRLEGGPYPVGVAEQEGMVGEAPRTCAWCATPAAPNATVCSSCGAALAQRESIGDVAIPGLTAVDAALQDYDKRPLHLRGPSNSQGMAPALIVGAVAGGPIGLAAIGGVAAVAAAQVLGTRSGSGSSNE